MKDSVHKEGFTLIELLMVIAIIAILSSIMVAGMSRVREAAPVSYTHLTLPTICSV